MMRDGLWKEARVSEDKCFTLEPTGFTNSNDMPSYPYFFGLWFLRQDIPLIKFSQKIVLHVT